MILILHNVPFFKEIIRFIQQRCIQLMKSDNKDIYIVTEIFQFVISTVLLNILSTKHPKNGSY